MPRFSIPSRSKKFTIAGDSDSLGNITYGKNIDFSSNRGSIRIAPRVKVLADQSDHSGWKTNQYPRGFIKVNTGGSGIPIWFSMVRDSSDGSSALWKTSGASPSTWSRDTDEGSPLSVRDSMDIAGQRVIDLGGGVPFGEDRLVIASGTDLAMRNDGNADTLSIASSTNATPIAITTSAAHLLGTGDRVTISGHLLNTPANGTWTITKTGPTSFTLDGSVGSAIGGASGYVTPTSWRRKWWTATLGKDALLEDHPIILRRFNKLLLVGNGPYVHVIDFSTESSAASSALVVSVKRLVFPSQFEVTWIEADQDYAWFGVRAARNATGGTAGISSENGFIARWNGGSESYERPLDVFGQMTFGACIVNGSPVTVNNRGQVLRYNGMALEQIAAFPIFNKKVTMRDNAANLAPSSIHKDGIKFIDNMIHIFINAAIEGDDMELLEDMPSGIWVLDPSVGLYCKYSVGQYRSTNSEWGARAIAGAGPLQIIPEEDGKILIGANVYVDNTPTTSSVIAALMEDSTVDHRALFCTTKLEADGMHAVFQEVIPQFERLTNSSDRIIVKARTFVSASKSYKRASITWTSTSTFTTTDADFANAAAGDEIEILVGKGAGTTAHISSISENAGTHTVTLDEAVPNVSGTAQVYLNNYMKIGSISDQNIQSKVMQLYRTSTWVQLKIELRGTNTSPELSSIKVTYQDLNI